MKLVIGTRPWESIIATEVRRATKSWYDELYKPGYNFDNPGYNENPGAGHFTQLVWKGTTELGIGIAKNGSAFFVVGRYRSAGNVTNAGYFAQNVLPLKSSSKAVPQPIPEPKPTMRPTPTSRTPTSQGLQGGTVTKKTTVRTETKNGKTIKTTTVVENGVTTVTTEEFTTTN